MSAEEEAYKDLIAGSSSEENDSLSEDSDGSANSQKKSRSQKRIEEMRRKLLGGLSEDKPRQKKSLQQEIDDFPENSDEANEMESDKEEL